ncbi:MAG: 4-(cytidine 5'-diphospho)-2-C-methyl-D-erythritol kinase [Pseudomonadota bacterium]
MEITLTAPAKVNLNLMVLGRRSDGYHELMTLMQPLSLADELVIDDQASGLEFSCDDPALLENNLVTRAARAYFQALGREPRARLRLIKRVPVAAGLGGGSSDAAAALLGLNVLHGQALAPQRLLELARGLGADVAFFLGGVTALCSGVGDRVRPWPQFPLLDYVLVNPGIAVSTAWVYGQFDLAWTNRRERNRISRSPNRSLPKGEILVNDLELVTVGAHPELDLIKQALLEEGAWGALMSGSGPTVFGVFAEAQAADRAARSLAARGGWWVRACRGIGA